MEKEYTSNTTRNLVVQLTIKTDQHVVEEVLKDFNVNVEYGIKKLKNSADLVIIDTATLQKKESQLLKLKEESSARLTSVLLVCEKDRVTELPFQKVVDDVIIKPLQPEILSLRIKSLLEKVNYSEQILKKKKEMIDEINSEWKDMVEQSPDLVQISIDGKIEYINPAGAKTYGANSAKEMIGKYIRHENDEMSVEELNNRIKVAQSGGVIPPRVLGIMTQTGKRRFVKAFSTPFMYKGRNAVHTVGQDITELMNTQKKLKTTISQKQALLQEVHHRVKNNLAIINGLIELQLDKMLGDESYSVLKATQSRILSISKVHELLYQQDHLDEIDANIYFTNLAEMINASFSGRDDDIEIKQNLDSFYLSLDEAIPCGLLLNELISNSLKHGFGVEDDKKIELTVTSKDNEVFFHYRDFGKGLDEDYDIEKPANFGMLIIRTLLGQLQADWEQRSENGFHLLFTFQKNEYNGPLKKMPA